MFGELGKRKTRERKREKTIAVCHLPVDSFSLIQTLHTVAPLAQLVSISSVCVCVCVWSVLQWKSTCQRDIPIGT